jgi:hypothetical protein
MLEPAVAIAPGASHEASDHARRESEPVCYRRLRQATLSQTDDPVEELYEICLRSMRQHTLQGFRFWCAAIASQASSPIRPSFVHRRRPGLLFVEPRLVRERLAAWTEESPTIGFVLRCLVIAASHRRR